jgi:hypothetical protein
MLLAAFAPFCLNFGSSLPIAHVPVFTSGVKLMPSSAAPMSPGAAMVSLGQGCLRHSLRSICSFRKSCVLQVRIRPSIDLLFANENIGFFGFSIGLLI